MKKFLTYSVVAATIAWSMGISAVLPAAAAYSAADGDVIKVAAKDRPAVYYVSGGKKYLMVNRVTYSTWASAIGDTADNFTGLKAISQADFDAISTGGNITVRPGTSLIKFDDSSVVYAVGTDAKLYKLADSAAQTALYGSAAPITIQSGFRSNYYDNGNAVATLTSTSMYPSGTLIKASTGDTYLVDGTNKRAVSTDAFTANGFKSTNVRTVTDLTAYGTGTALTSKESAISSPVSGAGAPVVGGNLSVSLSAATPASTVLASGTAYNKMVTVNLTAGSSEVKVTGVTVLKTGLVANSNVSGISVWDADGNKHGDVMTSISSDNKATISFGNYPITVAAGQTKTLTIAYNLGSSATSGTVGASVVGLDTNGTVSASYPYAGNIMTLANGGDSMSAVTVAAQAVGGATGTGTGNVEIGETKEIAKVKFTETTGRNDVRLDKVTFYMEGTARDKDVKDFTLVAPDNTVLGTTATVSDRYVTINLSNGYTIPKGTGRTLTLKGTIADGSGNNFRMQVQSEYDVIVKDLGTGYNVLPIDSAGTATDAWISEKASDGYFVMKSGTVTVNKATDSASGFISAGATDVTLATFDVKAVGEDVEIRKMGLKIATTSESYAKHLTGNVKIVADGATLATISAGDTAYTLYNTATQYSLSQYLTIPSGATKKVSVVASVSSNATSTSDFTVSFGNMYLKQLSTLAFVDNKPSATLVDGNNLQVQSTALTFAKDTGLPSKNVAAGSGRQEIARFVVKAGSAEGVKVTNVTINMVGNGAFSAPETLQNMDLWDGSTQLGSTVSNVATSSNSFSFSLNLAKDEQKVIKVMASVLSTATGAASTTVDSYTYIGNDTQNTTTVTDDVSGQVITLGTTAVTISAVSDDTASSQVMGPVSTPVQVGKWKVEVSNENATLSKITFTAKDGATYADDTTVGNFSALALYDGSTKLGDCTLTSGNVVCSGFNLVILADSYKYLTLKAVINESLDAASINGFVVKSDSNSDLEIRTTNLLGINSINGNGANTGFATSTMYKFETAYPTVVAESTADKTLASNATAEIFKFSLTNKGTRAMKFTTTTIAIAATGLTNASYSTGTIGVWKLYDDAGTLLSSTSTTGIAGGANGVLSGVTNFVTTGSLNVTFGQGIGSESSLLSEYLIDPGVTRTFTVKANTTNVTAGKSSGKITVYGSMTGNTTSDGAGSWTAGSVNYDYKPVGSSSYNGTQTATKGTEATLNGTSYFINL